VDHPQFFDPPYPLKYIQAGLQQADGLRVHLEDGWIHPLNVDEMLRLADEVRPGLVVVSATSFDVSVADTLVSRLKARASPPVVIGIGQGYYPSVNGQENPRSPYDAILLGEPEEEFLHLYPQLRAEGEDRSAWRETYREAYRNGTQFRVEHPDALPFPSYSPSELEAYRSIFPVRLAQRVTWGYLIGMRGCPHNCVFCSEVMRISIGKEMRTRSAAGVADEMEHLARQGANIVSFQDDSFSASRRFVTSVCRELIARGSRMPWMARVRVDELDFELLSLMKEAGCAVLGIGVESGCQRIIDEMGKTGKPKPWAQLCRQVFQWTHQLGIGTNAYYVIGNPSETREEIEQTIRLALKLNSDSIQVHFYTPYPGSKAWTQYRDRLADLNPAELFHYARPQVSLAEVSIEQLEELRSQFYRRYIFRPRWLWRHFRHYGGFYLRNSDIFFSLAGIRKVFWSSSPSGPEIRPEAVAAKEMG
jgi:radical SAM superfamily enzyme YgiQ (UPF0313 family)